MHVVFEVIQLRGSLDSIALLGLWLGDVITDFLFMYNCHPIKVIVSEI